MQPVRARSKAPDDHYIGVHGTVGDDFVYSDPLGTGGAGPAEEIASADLEAAMGSASPPRAAFAVVKPLA
jgi:hypothetical protein